MVVMAAQTSSTGHFDIPSHSETMQGLAVNKDQRLIDMQKKRKNWPKRFDISRCLLAVGSDVESVLVDMHSGGFASMRCASREPRKRDWLRVALLLSPV